MNPLLLKALNDERRHRRAAILLTPLTGGADRLIREGDAVPVEFGEAVGKAFRTGISSALTVEGSDWFMNVALPKPRLVVVGAVHISQALAPMAKVAGFDMEIIDPRTAFATPERFPDVPLYADWPEPVLRERPLDAYTAVAAVTHDPKIDDFALEAALNAGCFYVGALGSRKTHASRVQRLLEAGVSEEQIARIHAPIGLAIGAISPQEIAVSILAQVVQVFRSRCQAGAERSSAA
jgi:xanthine dehydrogenase accessory factor